MPVMITISGLNTEEVSKILSLITKLGNFNIETNATNVIYLTKANEAKAKKVEVQVPDPSNSFPKRKKKRHHFTEEEEEIFIVQNLEKMSYSEIARQLGLRRKQVEDKIYNMRKTGRWDEIKKKIEKKKEKSCNNNCRDCKYAKPEEVGNSIWCTRFNRRIFLEEAEPCS